jgi:uncharacterized Zn-finger protein
LLKSTVIPPHEVPEIGTHHTGARVASGFRRRNAMACKLLGLYWPSFPSPAACAAMSVQPARRDPAAAATIPANTENRYTVTRADLPLSCPMPAMSLWNSHPKVYLPVEASGSAKCPYCGAVYTLAD